MSICRSFSAFVFMIAPAFSQNPSAIPVIRGGIATAEPAPEDDLDPRPHRQAIGESDGLQPPGAPTPLDLPNQATTPNTGAPTVSVRQLRHPPSKTAVRAFADAKRDSAAGNHARAIDELRKAVEQSPEFGQAWSNLGVQYSLLGQSEAAILALEEAARLMPDEALIHTNLSYAYSQALRWDWAETEAREALRMDKNYAKAHYVLGHLLLLRGANLDEAVENLRMASAEVPKARLVLAGFYLQNARKEAAEKELRAYIAGTKGNDKAKAEQWLAELNRNRTAQDSTAASSLLPHR